MKVQLPKASLKFLVFIFLFLTSLSSWSQTYTQVTTPGGLVDGVYLFVGDAPSGTDGLMVNTASATPFINFTAIANPGATIASGATAANEFEVVVTGGVITIYNASVGFVSWGRTGVTGNNATFFNGTIANTERWTATLASGLWSLSNVGTPARLLQWNPSAPRFACYTGTQTNLKLYKKNVVVPTVISVAASSVGTTGATLNGTINANSTTTTASFEYGTSVSYGSTMAATPSTVTGTTVTPISATLGSLAVNTQYFYRAVGTVSGTPTNGSGLSFYTLAATPGVLTVSNPLQTTLDVTVNATTQNSNPAATQYAIQETSTGQYVQANGTLGATAVWQTAATWSTITVTGLSTATTYTFQAKARNNATPPVETAFGGTTSGTTLAPQTVDFAAIQFPTTTQNILENTNLNVFIKAYEPGLTDLSGPQSNLFGWVGYSSTNDNPANAGWTWVAASFNAELGNDDEYLATLTGLPVGTYYYAGRFQIGTGPFVYAGSNGVWNNDNVTLNVNADVVDFANIQSPTTATITEGGSVTIFAQVFESGVTEAAGQGAGITAEIGYSTSNTTPDGTWTWLPATYNVDFFNNDEYQADLGLGLAAGTYYYASRFIKTGSSTYVYGGTGGVWNNDNGVLTVDALAVPVATAATVPSTTSFTANWDAVTGASSYEIDVYEQTVITATDLFISEYVEGSSNNKYLEIYNGTGASVDLSDYDLVNYTNGSLTEGAPLALSGTLANNTAYVIANNSASVWGGTPDLVTSSSVMGFNGNDVIALRYLGTNIDVVGTIGDAANFAANTTLTRNSNIVSPTVTYSASDWASSTSDTVDNLGAHTFTGGTTTTFALQGFNVGNVLTYEVTGLNPETTYFYVVRAINGAVASGNSNEISVDTKPSSVTWNGTAWSNVTGPDEDIDAVIAGVYSASSNGNFIAKDITINSGSLTIEGGSTITAHGVIDNTLTAAAFVIESNGNLIQINTGTNTGAATISRATSSELRRLDYVLWSSPVVGQELLAFSPSTLVNRFYTYDAATDVYAAVTPSGTDFAPATGYLIRMPNNHSATGASWLGTFTGVPNNGDYNVGVTNGSYYAIGNPYPTTIDANTFITANGLSELYFWRKTNSAVITTSSYATYTTAGGLSNTGGGSLLEPNGTIQVGQGFLTQAASSSISFTNAMKVDNHDDQFLRTAAVERNRIWLNMTGANGIFGQTMIAYMTNATQGIDNAIDGRYINDSPIAINSLIEGQEFAIQGRSLPFESSDVVALGFKTTIAGNYSFAIDHTDGLFLNNDIAIYLKDNVTNTIHNLREGAYTFSTETGNFTSRFEIVYQNVLGVTQPIFDTNSVAVYTQQENIIVSSNVTDIKQVTIFDLRGRTLVQVDDVNTTSITINASSISNQILLVQVTSADGVIITKKVIK